MWLEEWGEKTCVRGLTFVSGGLVSFSTKNLCWEYMRNKHYWDREKLNIGMDFKDNRDATNHVYGENGGFSFVVCRQIVLKLCAWRRSGKGTQHSLQSSQGHHYFSYTTWNTTVLYWAGVFHFTKNIPKHHWKGLSGEWPDWTCSIWHKFYLISFRATIMIHDGGTDIAMNSFAWLINRCENP